MKDAAQLHVIEAIMVGVIVFVAIAMAALFRLPTSPATFQNTELERLANDTLTGLIAKPAKPNDDCNEPAIKCPFQSELERLLSLALGYEGPTRTGLEKPDVGPLTGYLNQSLPEGTRYILYYSNGVQSTVVFPVGLVPPSLDVAVGHALLSPNWTAHASKLGNQSVFIRIGEMTGFTTGGTANIYDPMNRFRDEWGEDFVGQFTTADGTQLVPVSALYGTYQRCSGTCDYFTVVPTDVFGAGASILPGDRDNATSLRVHSPLFTLLKYNDTDGGADGAFGAREVLYLDFDGSNTVSAGDLRMSRYERCLRYESCLAGTFVRSMDTDVGPPAVPLRTLPAAAKVRALSGDGDGELDEEEYLYLDVDGSGTVSANDARLSRVAQFPMGSRVAGAPSPDFDNGPPLASGANDFSSVAVVWADSDLDGTVDTTEAVYLDLVGNGQTSGLEALDLHLSPRGSPTTRYPYDIRLVVWFGV